MPGQYDYMVAQQIAAQDYPFYALIQAAMLKADTQNTAILRAVYPEEWAELDARYNAPGGLLPGEGQPYPTTITTPEERER
jgi:hypothetical protein